jgi:hypothetical protein
MPDRYPDYAILTELRPDPRVTPNVGGKDTPLTLEQIIAIGRDPGLTLHP